MDFTPSPHAAALRAAILEFLDRHVLPREVQLLHALDAEVGAGQPFSGELARLRALAREAGLWNLHLQDPGIGPGLRHVEYGVLCEEMGRSAVGPIVFNAQPPDSGNAEILHDHATAGQRHRWLDPLLAGEIRTCFAMTEPEVAGSDPTLIRTSAVRAGDDWIIDGHKWFATGALGAAMVIVMAVTDAAAPKHQRASMIIVPAGTPGFELVRPISVMGHSSGPGHWELRFTGCRVPAENLLGPRGEGFSIAQERLGPGRMHHCMRAVGAAERALELLCRRVNERCAFGGPLAEKQFVQEFVAISRLEIEQTRLLVLHAAWQMDEVGKSGSRQHISLAKIAAAGLHQRVLDRAMQLHGALGLTDDTPLAAMWRNGRGLRVLDGADEVHKMSVARHELRRWLPDKAVAA